MYTFFNYVTQQHTSLLDNYIVYTILDIGQRLVNPIRATTKFKYIYFFYKTLFRNIYSKMASKIDDIALGDRKNHPCSLCQVNVCTCT